MVKLLLDVYRANRTNLLNKILQRELLDELDTKYLYLNKTNEAVQGHPHSSKVDNEKHRRRDRERERDFSGHESKEEKLPSG